MKIYFGDRTPEDADVLWACFTFCRKCGEQLNRARHVKPEMRKHVETVAPVMSLCKNPEHNDTDTANFDIEILWMREWVEPED